MGYLLPNARHLLEAYNNVCAFCISLESTGTRTWYSSNSETSTGTTGKKKKNSGQLTTAGLIVGNHSRLVPTLLGNVRTGQGCQSCSWSAEQGNLIFPCSSPRLIVWSRETGPAVSFRVSPPILHTQTECGTYSRARLPPPAFRVGVYLFRQPPSGQSRGYRVMQERTDGVNHLEFAVKSRPLVLNVARGTGAT